MGDNSIKSNVCGLGGKGCALGDYPVCDRHQMIGVSKLPGEAPTNPGELRSWVDRWVKTVGNYGGVCQQSGIWSVYYGKRKSAPLGEAPLTPQAAGPAKAETNQEIEDVDEESTGWKTYLAIASASIFLCLGLVAGGALAWKRISKWRASKPIAKAPPPPLSEEEPIKPEAVAPETAKPEAAQPEEAAEAAREVSLEPVPIGPKAISDGPYKKGDPMPEGVIKAIGSIEQGFSTLSPNIQMEIAKGIWHEATRSENIMRLLFRDGRLTVDALNHWRSIAHDIESSVERQLIGDREVTLGEKILPDNFQGNAEDYIPGIIEEMRKIDTLFAKLPLDSQTRIASNIAQMPKTFQDGKLTVYAVRIGHGLTLGSAREREMASEVPAKATANPDQPRVSKPVTRRIDAKREGAIIHEKLMREFPDAKGAPFSFPSLDEGEREIIVEGILMQIEDSVEMGTWKEHFVEVKGKKRAFKPGALGKFLERHLEAANHSSLEGFRGLRRAETKRALERGDARDNNRKSPPPTRLADKPHGKSVK